MLRRISNSVYLPRGQVCRNQEHLLRQVNLVGLNRRPERLACVAEGIVRFAPRVLKLVMTGLVAFVASIASATGQIDTPEHARSAHQMVLAVHECDHWQDCTERLQASLQRVY